VRTKAEPANIWVCGVRGGCEWGVGSIKKILRGPGGGGCKKKMGCLILAPAGDCGGFCSKRTEPADKQKKGPEQNKKKQNRNQGLKQSLPKKRDVGKGG